MLFDRLPWTNFHELNLDWIIKNVKNLADRVTALENGGGDTPVPTIDPTIGDWCEMLAARSLPRTYTPVGNKALLTMTTISQRFDNGSYESIATPSGIKIVGDGLYIATMLVDVDNSSDADKVRFALSDENENLLTDVYEIEKGQVSTFTFPLLVTNTENTGGIIVAPIGLQQNGDSFIINYVRISIVKVNNIYATPLQ